MKITIAERFLPFSHVPGASCLLPRTAFVVEAFPSLLRVKGLFEMPLNHLGPVREFTLQQDLEKGCVYLRGIAKEGRFRHCIRAERGYVEVDQKKFPHASSFLEPRIPLERLSLGSHRSQDWELVLRRFDLRQILPTLFHLSHWIPDCGEVRSEMLSLLEKDWESFLRAAFSKILTPRLKDEEHQGLIIENEEPEGSPCALVKKAGKKIRSLFFDQEGQTLRFLPSCDFESGRMTDVSAEGVGFLDFVWRKNSLRRLILRPASDVDVRIQVPKAIASFRFRNSRQEKGFRVKVNEDVLSLKAGGIYFADRFQK